MLLDVALADKGVSLGAYEPHKPEASSTRITGEKRDEVFERPIFIISPPARAPPCYSKTLAQARGLFTVGQEIHALIEGIPSLYSAYRDFASNRLDADAATAEQLEELRQRLFCGTAGSGREPACQGTGADA